MKNTEAKILISDEFAKNLIKRVHLKFGHIGQKYILLTITPSYICKNLTVMGCKNLSELRNMYQK